MFFTYVLYTSKYDKIYIGQTNNLELTLSQHNKGLAQFTKKFLPWELVYFEEFQSRSEAMIREKQLKSHKGRDYIRSAILKQIIFDWQSHKLIKIFPGMFGCIPGAATMVIEIPDIISYLT